MSAVPHRNGLSSPEHHQPAERLRYLVEKGGKSFDEARKTAQREVLSSFGITLSDTTTSDQMDISRNGDGAGRSTRNTCGKN